MDKDEAPLSTIERSILFQNVVDEAFGFGPLTQFLKDPQVTEIAVHGLSGIYVKKAGAFEQTAVVFENAVHLKNTVDKILKPLGMHIDEHHPVAHVHLPNGSPVVVVAPPAAADGLLLSIRSYGCKLSSLGQLVEQGLLTKQMAETLKECIKGKANMLISGLPGTGRNTLISCLAAHMKVSDWVVSVEHELNMRLQHANWVRLRTVPANADGRGEVTFRQLIADAASMRPDRLVLGECPGSESYYFLQALNTGRAGDIALVTARSSADCLRRLENVIRLADPGMPTDYARALIADNIHVIAQTAVIDGKFKISEIVQVGPLEESKIKLTSLCQQ